MKYMGSKNRIAKYILPIILKDRKVGQWYVEPFAGGMNTIDKVDGRRLANDIHVELIAMWHSIVDNGWLPPVLVSEEDYNNAKNNKNDISMALDGYIGFNSFGGKWYAGYRRDSQGKRDYWKEHYNNIMKQAPKLKGVVFANFSYSDLPIPNNSVIYCDPPYANTTKYKDDFCHDTFWQWCRDKHKDGHKIFILEYNAPDDFKCVWEMQVTNSMHQTKTYKPTEKLFTL